MRLLFLLLKYCINRIVRHLYWLYRLMQVEKGNGFTAKFPIRTEGRGKLKFGNNCNLGKNVFFACGSGCNIEFGNNCRIDENVEIIAGENAKISFADNCWIMKNTIIRTKNTFSFGNNVQIATNCAIFSRENGHEGSLTVGIGTHIGDNTIIDVACDIIIGKEIAIGPNCVIYTHDHNYKDKTMASWKGGVVKHAIVINDGAWIASSVTILPNVKIGERCVVAAGSVLTKNAISNHIYGGVPAKIIKKIE